MSRADTTASTWAPLRNAAVILVVLVPAGQYEAQADALSEPPQTAPLIAADPPE